MPLRLSTHPWRVLHPSQPGPLHQGGERRLFAPALEFSQLVTASPVRSRDVQASSELDLERGLLARPPGNGGRGRNHVHFASQIPREGKVISGMRQDCEIAVYLDIDKALLSDMRLFLGSNGVILTPGFDGVIPVVCLERIVCLSTGAVLWSQPSSVSVVEPSIVAGGPQHQDLQRPSRQMAATPFSSQPFLRFPAMMTFHRRYKVGIEPHGGFKAFERLVGADNENIQFIQSQIGGDATVEVRGQQLPTCAASGTQSRWTVPFQLRIGASKKQALDSAASLVEDLLGDLHEQYHAYRQERGLASVTLRIVCE